MTSQESTAADLEQASERWLAWLAAETAARQEQQELTEPAPAGRPGPSGSALSVLWDALEEWFASDDFAGSVLAAAVVAPPDGRGPAAHAVLVRHRQATRRLLEDLARSAGAPDPAALAGQLLTLVEGAMAGALVDRHPGVARHARELTRIALAAAAARGEASVPHPPELRHP
jgi:hypothetical protein